MPLRGMWSAGSLFPVRSNDRTSPERCKRMDVAETTKALYAVTPSA